MEDDCRNEFNLRFIHGYGELGYDKRKEGEGEEIDMEEFENTADLLLTLNTTVGQRIEDFRERQAEMYPNSLTDLITNRFQGKRIEDIEIHRVECLEKLKGMDKSKQAAQFLHYAKEIDTWEHFFSFQEIVVDQMWILVSTEVCYHLFDKSFSLSEISEILPWVSKTDIYALSLAYGAHIPITEEEKDQIKTEYMRTGTPKILSKVFGDCSKDKEGGENSEG